MNGKLIVLEGGEGVGKTTQMANLKEHLPHMHPNREFLFTREPGGSPFADEVRKLILADDARHAGGAAMMGLLIASRSDHVEKVVRPALLAGKVVVSDRYISSTYAIQIVGQEAPELEDLFRAHLALVPRADATIVIEADPAIIAKRVEGRGAANHFDGRDAAFHARVQDGFRKFIAMSGWNGLFIEGDRSREEVWRDIEKAVTSVL